MYYKAWCTCRAVVLIIKPIVFWSCRRRRGSSCLSSLLQGQCPKEIFCHFNFPTWRQAERAVERAVSTAILLLCTVYSKFLLCLLFRFPGLLSESRFCRCSFRLCLASFSFLSLNKQHLPRSRAVYHRFFICLFVCFHFFPTWPSIIRLQFNRP